MISRFFLFLFFFSFLSFSVGWSAPDSRGGIDPKRVVVVYNTLIPQSKALAYWYAKKRDIPEAQVVGFQMPDNSTFGRKAYQKRLEDPLRELFSKRKWWVLRRDSFGNQRVVSRAIDLIVCVKGVPYRIAREGGYPKKGHGGVLAANEASVDSELALLGRFNLSLKGGISNPYYQKTKPFHRCLDLDMFLVGRIDASDYGIVRQRVEEAMEVEKTGLWGMSYIDLAYKPGGYKQGDDWLKHIVKENQHLGIPTVIEKTSQTFSGFYPMGNAAIYFGWYTTHANGPLLNPQFLFKKGAIAVHLHSFSASDLGNAQKHWCAPLLAHGAAATLGNVYEPFLHWTHHFDIFYKQLLEGKTLVEAAYSAIPWLSWQNIVLGDPLYRPFLYIKNGGGRKTTEDRPFRLLVSFERVWGESNRAMWVKKVRTKAAALSSGALYESLGLYFLDEEKQDVADQFFSSASKHYLSASDALRCELHRIHILLAKGQKPEAIQRLTEAIEKAKEVPEVKSARGLLARLLPPQPPAVETLPPPPSP